MGDANLLPRWLSRHSASLVRTRSRVQISPEAFVFRVMIPKRDMGNARAFHISFFYSLFALFERVFITGSYTVRFNLNHDRGIGTEFTFQGLENEIKDSWRMLLRLYGYEWYRQKGKDK